MSEFVLLIPAVVASLASVIAFYSVYRSKKTLSTNVENLNLIITELNSKTENNSSLQHSYLKIYEALDEVDEAVVQIGNYLVIKTVSDESERKFYNFEISEQEREEIEQFFVKEQSIPKLIDHLFHNDSIDSSNSPSKSAKLVFPQTSRVLNQSGT